MSFNETLPAGMRVAPLLRALKLLTKLDIIDNREMKHVFLGATMRVATPEEKDHLVGALGFEVDVE